MEKIVSLSVCCKICGENKGIRNVSLEGYNNWYNGVVIQKALPELSDDERELMITNICRQCWDGMFEELEKDQQKAEDDFPGLDDSLVKRMPDYERKTGRKPT